ncbi:uncharacterized protein LOC62_03G003537 [Vanrija pseudolonga]|uniref:Uncharacterized protein n=1 Tax=Vanrija pseudolonga TaxID=143232 RepID=A0AAF1BPY5_9TREE|nr:hypothetical protein LOC62_03G003537 [Vanrija pseudolonga]
MSSLSPPPSPSPTPTSKPAPALAEDTDSDEDTPLAERRMRARSMPNRELPIPLPTARAPELARRQTFPVASVSHASSPSAVAKPNNNADVNNGNNDNETVLLRSVDDAFQHVLHVKELLLSTEMVNKPLAGAQKAIIEDFEDSFSYDDPSAEDKHLKKVKTVVKRAVDRLRDFIDPKGGADVPHEFFKERVENAKCDIKSAMFPGWEKWV